MIPKLVCYSVIPTSVGAYSVFNKNAYCSSGNSDELKPKELKGESKVCSPVNSNKGLPHAELKPFSPFTVSNNVNASKVVATSLKANEFNEKVGMGIFQRFYKNVSDRSVGLLMAYPFDALANVTMNQGFKNPSQSFLNNWLDSFKIFQSNLLKASGATFLEYVVHRGAKVGAAVTVQDVFSDYDATAKRLLKSATIFGIEVLIAPVHAFMILTTTGEMSYKDAVKRMVMSPDGRFSPRQPWAGAVAFALKGVTFSPAQFEAWDYCERLFDKKCKDMNTKEQVFTYVLGALCGSIVSMPATRLYYNSAVRIKNPPTSLTEFSQFLRSSLQFNTAQTKQFLVEWQTFIKSAYVKNAVLNKTFWKALAHVLMHIK